MIFGLISLVLILQQTQAQDRIFFPRKEPTVETPCIAYDGSRGICRLLVQCATFFAEIAELSRSPCSITEAQQGVCCPALKSPSKDPNLLVKDLPLNRAIVFPDVTTNDLNTACERSLNTFENRQNFEKDLVKRRIVAQPNSAVFWHSRLFETTDEIVQKSEKATVILEASKDLSNSFRLNKEQAQNGLKDFRVKDTIIQNFCPLSPRCPDPKYSYRTADGSCNNLRHTDWGSTGIPYARMLQPDFQDGVSIPRLSERGVPLPSARHVSTMISPAKSDLYNNLTILIWQWGQFLDHDITHTPISKGAGKSDITCCKEGRVRQARDLHPDCMPISIPRNDQFFAKFGQHCMEFVRSMAAIREGCKFGYRDQMNQITSYIDASNVYGSTEEEAEHLRTFRDGLLRVSTHGGRELLPGNSSFSGCIGRSVREQCFVAGDTRVNEQPNLAVLHTVWVRQHNKIVRKLKEVNPQWSDEILYHEGRRIVGAQMQHITYNEYLPIVLGKNFMESFGLLPLKKGYFRGYRDDVDATILNSFATAAFRYGHTLITDTLQGFGKFGHLKENMELSKTQFVPFSLYQPDTLDSLIRGLSLQQSQKFDRFFSEQLTNKLFAQHRDFGMDLVALNIQRGRDHGLPPYNKWREACGLSSIRTWQDMRNSMRPEALQQMKSAYESVEDIDLFVGGIAEDIVKGTLLGPTFLCIIGRQFTTLKIGDRFYYENGAVKSRSEVGDRGEFLSSFTEAQLNEIRKTSLARILCDNSDDIELMQPLAFVTAHLANKRAVCRTNTLIPQMSLEPWENSRIWTK